MLDSATARHLAARFAEVDYTVDAVVELIGHEAHAALGRNSTVPAVRVLARHDGPLATLTRLWLLQRPVARAALDVALPGLADCLLAAGILQRSGREVCARIDLRPYASDDGASGWIAADLTPNLDTRTTPMRPDFVLGVSPASTTLAQLTVRRPVGRTLDLGTGCGVQSLHLARHAATVVATDINPRALTLARLTADLNNVDVDLRLGSLYEPVGGEQFDLITTNPPYVIAPPASDTARLSYREGAETADHFVERVVREGAAHLAPGGLLSVLGNWAHVRGEEWSERLHRWIAPTGCAAHVVQREVLDPSTYVELWLADAGLAGRPDYVERYDAWLEYFDTVGIEAVGLGWLVLHSTDRPDPTVRIEHWPYAVEQPIAPAFAAELDARELLRGLDDDAVLARTWRLAPDVVEETTGPPGAADPASVVLRQQRGFRRALTVDTALGGILGACDGELPLGRIVDTVAELLAEDPAALTRRTLDAVPSLVVDGILTEVP